MRHLHPLRLTLGFLVAIHTSDWWNDLRAEPLPTEILISKAPDGNSGGEPPNRPKAGGGLDGGRTCLSTRMNLWMLVPEQNPVFTDAAQPTVWVYVPHEASDVRTLELTLSDYGDDNLANRPYRQQVTLPATPGVVGIRLPAGLVQLGRRYRWYLELYCRENEGQGPDQSVEAGLRRIVPNSPEVLQASPPGYWYDRVTTLARQRLADPNNPQLQRQWAALLTEIGQGEIADKPLLGEVELPAP